MCDRVSSRATGPAPCAPACQRAFLGWHGPLVNLAAAHLVDREISQYPVGAVALDRDVLVIPSRRGADRLLQALVLRAETQDRFLLAPRIVTPGALPLLLVPARRPVPDVSLLAFLWALCLHNAPDRVRLLFAPNVLDLLSVTDGPASDTRLPSARSWTQWLGLGAALAEVDAQVSGELLTLHDLAAACEQGDLIESQQRWQALASVRQDLGKLLDQHGFEDRGVRLREAVENNAVGLGPEVRRIVLVGCVDFSESLARLLAPVADRVLALVHAPNAIEDRFDSWGRVIASKWQDGVCVALPQVGAGAPFSEPTPALTPDESLGAHVTVQLVDRPEDQAYGAALALTRLATTYAIQDVVVGVPDRTVLPALLQVCADMQVPVHDAVGMSVADSPAGTLLGAVADYLSDRSFASLAAVARHADVGRIKALAGTGADWCGRLDRYQAAHLTMSLGQGFVGEDFDAALLNEWLDAFHQILGPLMDGPKPLADWIPPILDLLIACYGDVPSGSVEPRAAMTVRVCVALRDALAKWKQVPAALVGTVSACDALRLLRVSVQAVQVANASEPGVLELLGWLDIAYDPTAALVLTGFNDGFVPGAPAVDAWLPDSVRRRLGMMHSARGFARDAYALSAIVASRRSVTLLAGRYSANSDPLRPSRLWLLDQPKQVAQRVIAFYEREQQVASASGYLVRPNVSSHGFRVALPEPLQQSIDALPVTAFRDYLACPYRFYLRHVRKLRPVGDDPQELDAMSFGSLAHEVLQAFGRSVVASSTDAMQIYDFLSTTLTDLRDRRFGSQCYPPVRLQVEQLRGRLHAFAQWQAVRARDFEIVAVEKDFAPEQVSWPLDGRRFSIYGRIDRIERHRGTREIHVMDYKTSATARKDPARDHVGLDGTWHNFQLPLYSVLAMGEYEAPAFRLGYINLPAKATDVGAAYAQWTKEQLNAGLDVARDVVRRIWMQEFWPPRQLGRGYRDDYAVLCEGRQDGAGVVQEGRP